jgi:hypothetical protein
MDCWHCRKTALGACRFCGRGICEDHIETRPFILSVYRGGESSAARALVVEDALFCGKCTPRQSPVELPELDL